MKRPLFIACLTFIAVLCILTSLGVFSCDKNKHLLPEEKTIITLTGKVCNIDSKKIYINCLEHKKLSADAYNVTEFSTLPRKFIFTAPLDELSDSNIPAIGNTIQITGLFRSYSHATNPGEFDSFDYYSSNNIYGSLSKIKLTVLSGNINPIKQILYDLRLSGINSLNQHFSPANASILGDLLFGDKASLDSDTKDLYRKAGISHILSISSLHISILGLGLLELLKRIGCHPKIAAVISCLFLILFCIMTGMSISAMRSIGIYILAVIARLLGRTVDSLTSLSLVAAILLLINPSQLTSCGFLLSFGSVIGITCLYPALKLNFSNLSQIQVSYHPDTPKYKFQKFILNRIKILFDSLLSGISITLTTLPIQLYFFYEIPTYSFAINLMVIPLLAVLMVCGYISAVFPFLYIPNKVCELILFFYNKSSQLVTDLPGSTWNPGRPTVIKIIIYYSIWLGVVCSPYISMIVKKIKNNTPVLNIAQNSQRIKAFYKLSITFAAFTLMFLWFNVSCLPADSIVFLDVGQGDCAIMHTDSGEVYLFDGGSSSRSYPGQYIIKNALKYYGFSHINSIYISHTDKDHINGIIELLNNSETWGLTIDNLYLPKYSDCEANSDEAFILNAAFAWNRHHTDVYRISSGYTAISGSTSIICLHPTSDFIAEDTNSASLCILINTYGNNILMCGDIAGSGEVLLNSAILPYNPISILKVSHHGSRFSTTDDFLDAANPQLAIISAGANNSYGHPHQETLDRLIRHNCRYLSTIESGAIQITIRSNRLDIKKYSP